MQKGTGGDEITNQNTPFSVYFRRKSTLMVLVGVVALLVLYSISSDWLNITRVQTSCDSAEPREAPKKLQEGGSREIYTGFINCSAKQAKTKADAWKKLGQDGTGCPTEERWLRAIYAMSPSSNKVRSKTMRPAAYNLAFQNVSCVDQTDS
jgi:hypothetical protein